MRGFVVAGVSSGSGKTLISLALMAWFARKGWDVQPFKVGPDFIDPGHHCLVTGRTSHNLDGWMLSQRVNREIFLRYGRRADLCVVEGVMGLFDGFSPTGESGSTAEMAKWLGLPVLLVVDARSLARSAAAMVKGYAEFDPELSLAGVLFNRVGSPSHAAILHEAVHNTTGLSCFGFLPHDRELSLPSRHLGLVTAQESTWDENTVDQLANWVDSGLSSHFERAVSGDTSPYRAAGPIHESGSSFSTPAQTDREAKERDPVRIAVAWDEAFCFYYGENLRLLREAGAWLCFFSPLRDKGLPQGVGGLYLGGGYPELYAEPLSRNTSLMTDVARLAGSGRAVYAECGGFMYLMRSIRDGQGVVHPMAGVFPLDAVMGDRFRALGYREIHTLERTPLGDAGTVLRGHEFHYSHLQSVAEAPQSVYRVRDRRGEQRDPQGFLLGSVLGSYIHVHFGSNTESARSFVCWCRDFRGSTGPAS
jgi:cobyrinic acid a,c-diamide synthase